MRIIDEFEHHIVNFVDLVIRFHCCQDIMLMTK
jgi:hypothetical protein